MPHTNLIRWSGLAALVGGTTWTAAFAMYALEPSGPGSETPYRSFGNLGPVILASLALIACGLLGLHVRSRRAYGRLGTTTSCLALAGIAVLVISVGAWPWILIGGVALAFGSLLVGAATLSAGTLPAWAALTLIAGSAIAHFFNTETAAAWSALPYGVAWVAVGYVLWSRTTAEQESRALHIR